MIQTCYAALAVTPKSKHSLSHPPVRFFWGKTPRYPIRINLRNSLQFHQQLVGVRSFIAPIHSTSGCQASCNLLNDHGQGYQFMHCSHEHHHIISYGLGCLYQASVGIPPTTHQYYPMLDYHTQYLSVHFTEDTPGIGAAPLVDLSMTLPQLET